MSETPHTPIPWTHDGEEAPAGTRIAINNEAGTQIAEVLNFDDFPCLDQHDDCEQKCKAIDAEAQANAVFICLAVNSQHEWQVASDRCSRRARGRQHRIRSREGARNRRLRADPLAAPPIPSVHPHRRAERRVDTMAKQRDEIVRFHEHFCHRCFVTSSGTKPLGWWRCSAKHCTRLPATICRKHKLKAQKGEP